MAKKLTEQQRLAIVAKWRVSGLSIPKSPTTICISPRKRQVLRIALLSDKMPETRCADCDPNTRFGHRKML